MEVIPHWEIDEVAIEDIANFFCNACSCQVKQANPGFDLLASVNWEQRLFNGITPEPIRTESLPSRIDSSSSPLDSPQYVTIPGGDVNPNGNSKNESAASADEISARKSDPSSSTMMKMLLVAGIALVSGGILRGALRLRR
jgi:hypothetical protein